jgi:Na+/melibiose symporter-like transporter
MLSGSISDGLATNLISYIIDVSNSRYGKTTPWYIFGTILTIPTFLLMFHGSLANIAFCGYNDSW